MTIVTQAMASPALLLGMGVAAMAGPVATVVVLRQQGRWPSLRRRRSRHR